MPAAIDSDDVTKPVDSDIINYPASQGAGEFRALKAKINKLFLLTGVDHDGEFLLTTNGRGIYVNYTATPVSGATILYGFASNVTRSGGDNHTVGAQVSGYLGNNITLTGTHATFGVVTQAISGTVNSVGNLVGGEFAACNLWNANSATKLGIDCVFKNRADGAAAEASGLGANQYNLNALAVQISAQSRGSGGAFCGWTKGIYFTEFSLDLSNIGGTPTRGYAIDAFDLHYDGGADARFAYRVDAVLRMRSMQSIMWDDGAGSKIRMYMDPFTSRLTFTNEGIGGIAKFFEVHVTTGALYRNGVIVP